jgi:hypothetical protein
MSLEHRGESGHASRGGTREAPEEGRDHDAGQEVISKDHKNRVDDRVSGSMAVSEGPCQASDCTRGLMSVVGAWRTRIPTSKAGREQEEDGGVISRPCVLRL